MSYNFRYRSIHQKLLDETQEMAQDSSRDRIPQDSEENKNSESSEYSPYQSLTFCRTCTGL